MATIELAYKVETMEDLLKNIILEDVAMAEMDMVEAEGKEIIKDLPTFPSYYPNYLLVL